MSMFFNENIKQQRVEINNLRTEIKAIFGLLNRDGSRVVNEGIVHDELKDIQGGDSLVVKKLFKNKLMIRRGVRSQSRQLMKK